MDAGTIIDAVKGVTKKWARQRRREEREADARARRREALTRTRRVTIKEAAYEVMEAAYLQASANGTLPAKPRQIFYRARPHVLEATGQESLDGQYFSQTLLVNYMAENPETTAAWDIAWDDRGHFAEPHTGKVIGLGTLAVREYLEGLDGAAGDLAIPLIGTGFPTAGPRNRCQAILFIEKEGFMPLFEAVHLAERYDLAIMSSKGLSSTAARTLVDSLCGEYGIPLLVLHDFDKSGFSILGTLRRDTRRYSFENEVDVIDLGLRLADVRDHQLQAERVNYGKSDPVANLRENGATADEIAFLCSERHWTGYSGQRVELNAFPSDTLLACLEGKLKRHGIKKVVPDAETLERAFRRDAAIAAVNKALPELVTKARQDADAMKLPANLAKAVQRKVRDNPAMPWDAVVAELAAGAGH
jgi:hypothetical protein